MHSGRNSQPDKMNMKKIGIIATIMFLITVITISFSSALLNEDLWYYWSFDQITDEPEVAELVFGLSEGAFDRPAPAGFSNYTQFALLGNASQGDGINPNGVNANYSVLASNYTDFLFARTVQIWFSANVSGQTNGIINASYLNDDGTGPRLWNLNNTDNFALVVGQATGSCDGEVFTVVTGGRDCLIDSTISLAADGVFHHLVVSYNDSVTGYEFYLDGVQLTNVSRPFATPVIVVNRPVVGRGNAGGSGNWNGTLDEFGIWNRSLTGVEISELYNAGVGLTFAELGPGDMPFFTTIPANVSVGFGSPVSETFAGNDTTDGFVNFVVDDLTNFKINLTTGLLQNATVLGAGEFVMLVTINDSVGNTNSTAYNVTVTQTVSTCSISSDITDVPFGGSFNVTASCTNPEVAFTLFRDGVNVTETNSLTQTLAPATYTYLANVSGSQNFTSATTADLVIIVTAASASETLCLDGTLSFENAVPLAGLILIIIFVVGILGLLFGLAFFKVDVTAVVTVQNVIAGVVAILALFLVVAISVFVFGDSFCPIIT